MAIASKFTYNGEMWTHVVVDDPVNAHALEYVGYALEDLGIEVESHDVDTDVHGRVTRTLSVPGIQVEFALADSILEDWGSR